MIRSVGMAAGLVLALLSGCASTQSGREADSASPLDLASTGVALNSVSGAAELNPLALPLVPVRYMMSRYLEKRPCLEKRSGHAMLSGVGIGAMGNNLLVLAGAGFPPLGLLAGIPIYRRMMARPCVPVLSDEHMLLLAKWRDAYERGDDEALARIPNNEKVRAHYSDLFARTTSRLRRPDSKKG